MSNTADIIIKEQTITVTPQNVQGLVKYDGGGYAVIFEDGTSLSISKADYDAIKALDYSQGGGGAGGGIQSSTINNMEFDGDKTLTINGNRANIPTSESISTIDYADNALIIDGEEVEVGGSNMVYNTSTGKLAGAKDQNGNDVTFEVGTITIQF